MTNNKRLKSHKGHSTHARSYRQEADYSDQRDYDRPIHSQKVIPDNYDRNDDEKPNENLKAGGILVIESG